MTTLIPTTSSQPAAGVEAYEDMFKEITRKLYGEESAHGLYPHNTQIAQVAQLAPGAPAAAPEGGERSFTTLVSDRNITTIDYETTTVNDQGQQQQGRSEEHLTTAFGLAALMQNGFPPPGAILNPVNFPAKANLVAVTSDDRWQQQQEQTSGEQSWSSGGGKHSSTSYSHKSGKKPKVEPLDGSPTGSGSTLNIPQSDKSKGNFSPSSATVGAATGKRYACTSCPYTTDRRDLFTRHENIHKEEKPFHCYACLKQFNRADHVKKHFMRMHRDMDYEIAKTRRITAVSSTSTPTSSTAKPYYSSSSSNTPVSAPAPPPPTTLVSPPVTVIPVVSTLNIPTANFPAQLSIPSSHHGTATIESSSHGSTVTAVINSHNIVTLNGSGLIQHHHQQQQNQQQQHQPVLQQQQQQQQQIVVNAPPIVAIKQEKGVQPRAEGAGNSNGSNAANLVDDKSFAKKNKGEKRFTCCYCPWSGADNWGLKRHLNTHTKPYVCMLCDYKAARSERLATHVFKVHNKKACSKCTFFAEDQDQLNAHMQDSHPNEPAKPVKPATSPIGGGSTGNVLRSLGNTFVPNNLHGNNPTSSGNSFGTSVVNNSSSTNTTILYQTTTSTSAIPSTGNILTNSNASNLIDTINQHLAANGGTVTVVSGNGLGGGVGQVTTPHNHHQQQQQNHLQHNQNQNQQQQQIPQQQQQQHHWIAKVHRKRGSELLYSYLEADGSDSEDYARLLSMQALGRNKTSVTQDFHNAGGGTHRQYHANHNSDSNSSSIDSSNDQPSSPPLSSASSRSPSTSPPVVASTTATPNHLSEEHLSLLQLLATAAVAQQHLQLQQQQKSASSILSSPPASHPPQPPPAIVQNTNQNSTNQAQNDAKRRRKSSSRNDKENLGQKQPNRSVAVGGKVIDLTVTAAAAAASDTGNGIERNNNSSSNNNNSSVNNKNINEAIFDRVMYKKPSYQNMFLTAAFCKPVLGVEKDPRREDRVIVAEKSFSLAEFLRNHTEVSISTLNSTATTAKKPNDDEDVIFIKEEKRRKQQAPRKVDQPPSSERSVGDIRDKHMIRLITRRLCCRICQNQHVAPDNCHYHTKTSLILHQRWRHGQGAATDRCQHCGAAFARRYKLALHQKLMHRNRKPGAKKTVKKQQRKQRKRKPRSQCFTKRRK
ncbi:protein charlatan isoform X3 [Culex pipiens pallens]|uniref:protein charlatan isoform X3 n=1 Tax=Culex pipiens pallens TaxID=42434 RepID=UPI001953A8B9|nr:protein charlatan isoform X3 [Culex pipiens pallens]